MTTYRLIAIAFAAIVAACEPESTPLPDDGGDTIDGAAVEHVTAGEHCYEVAVNTCASGAVEWECWDPAQIDGRAVADPYSGCVEHVPSVTGTARYCCP